MEKPGLLHSATHAPHATQRSATISRWPSTLRIARAGQCRMQLMHSAQEPISRTEMRSKTALSALVGFVTIPLPDVAHTYPFGSMDPAIPMRLSVTMSGHPTPYTTMASPMPTAMTPKTYIASQSPSKFTPKKGTV